MTFGVNGSSTLLHQHIVVDAEIPTGGEAEAKELERLAGDGLAIPEEPLELGEGLVDFRDGSRAVDELGAFGMSLGRRGSCRYRQGCPRVPAGRRG